MEILGKVIQILGAEFNEIPPSYGVFHLSMATVVILATLFISLTFKNSGEKTFRRIFLIAWIILVVLEAYKQFIYTFSYEDGSVVADYPLYIFPFQFCSMPLYVFPIIAFVKNKKVFTAACYFVMTYVLFAGLAVYVYPGDIFVYTIGVNFQTSIHHGTQIVLGIYTAVWLRKQIGYKKFLSSVPLFLITVLVAATLNYVLRGIDDKFNMFFISPYVECPLPVLQLFYPPALSPLGFICLYVLGFTAAALIILSLQIFFIKIFNKRK